MSWLSGHRSGVVRWAIGARCGSGVGDRSTIFWNVRSSAADIALGAAMDTYNAPLAQPGAPPEKGVYATSADASKAPISQFVAVANEYRLAACRVPRRTILRASPTMSWARMASAETELKTAAGSWDRNLSNLAKLALAGLYHQTARDAQAIDLYNAIAAKPSDDRVGGRGATGPGRSVCREANRIRLGPCGPK